MDSWETLLELVDSFRRAVGRARADRASAAIRQEARDLVQSYFRDARLGLSELGLNTDLVQRLDGLMQDLLRLSQGRSRLTTYRQRVTDLRDVLRELDSAREVRLGEVAAAPSETIMALSQVETRLLATLEALVPTAELSYRQALMDLRSPERISFRGTANELRETVREVLDHLAPDPEVMASEGFRFEHGQTRPTQRQKVRFILASRGLGATARRTPETSASLIDEEVSRFARSVYERGSLDAHISTTRQRVQQLKMYVDSILAELLEIHA